MSAENGGVSEETVRLTEKKRGFWDKLLGRKSTYEQPVSEGLSSVSHSPMTASSAGETSVSQTTDGKHVPSRWEQTVIREHARLQAVQKEIVDTQGLESLQVMMQLGMYPGPQFSPEENTLWYEEMMERKRKGELTSQQAEIVEQIHSGGGGAAQYSDRQNEDKSVEDGMIPRARLEALYKRNPNARHIMDLWFPIELREAKQYNAWKKHIIETKGAEAVEREVPPRPELSPQENSIWKDMMALRVEMGLLTDEEQAVLKESDGRAMYEDTIMSQVYKKFVQESEQLSALSQQQQSVQNRETTKHAQRVIPEKKAA